MDVEPSLLILGMIPIQLRLCIQDRTLYEEIEPVTAIKVESRSSDSRNALLAEINPIVSHLAGLL